MLNKSRIYTLIMIFFLVENGIAQDSEDYVYFFNFVHHSNNQLCEHLPPTTTFTTYLNNLLSRIFIENYPLWKQGSDPNINRNAVFGIELSNFTDSTVQPGSSVYIHFICKET